MVIKRWITPIPPKFAIAIAISDSQTVSIFAADIGILSSMFLENVVSNETSCLERIVDF